MSLLMDALKKAEAEKKAAAEKSDAAEAGVQPEQTLPPDDAPADTTDTAELSLEPLNEQSVETAQTISVEQAVPDETIILESPTADAAGSFSEDLTRNDPILIDDDDTIDPDDTVVLEGLTADDVAATLDDTLHEVIAEDEREPDIYGETLPGVSVEVLAKDLGGGKFRPTPVAAQTVFTVGRSRTENKHFFVLAAVGVLSLVAIGSFSVFYYYSVTPVTRNVPAPTVAHDVGLPPAAPSPMVPRPEQEAVAATIGQADATDALTVEPEPITENRPTPAPAAAELTEALATPETGAPEPDQPPRTDPAEDTVAATTAAADALDYADTVQQEFEADLLLEADTIAAAEAVDPSSTGADKQRLTGLPLETMQPDPTWFRISRERRPGPENVMLEQAYQAYQDGDYQAAESIYQALLKQEPDNRDVRLGLAAIGINNGDKRSAYAHYAHILKLNPGDSLALNALISMSDTTDPVSDESAVKILLQRENELPYLHFSLGNLYARQQRWAAAQQAFFDAYRYDTTNPDYAVNLAISLDRLGQYATALDYYKTALELRLNRNARFDQAAVTDRVLALSEILE